MSRQSSHCYGHHGHHGHHGSSVSTRSYQSSRQLVPYASAPSARSANPNSLELYLQVSRGQTVQSISTWRLFLKAPGSDNGTLMEVLGVFGRRDLHIVNNEPFRTRKLNQSIYLGAVSSSQSGDVIYEAGLVPAQHPQLWCCYVMLRLEHIGILPQGTSDHFRDNYEFGEAYDVQDNDLVQNPHGLRIDDFGMGPSSQSQGSHHCRRR